MHRVITRVVRAAVSRHEERLTRESRTERVITSATGVAPERQVQRMETLAAILRSLATFAIYGIAVLTCMAIIGIPLAPLLASAGVGGVALGFGAQSLVKDFLSGIFMIIEDQYGVGDYIDTGEAIGFVEDEKFDLTELECVALNHVEQPARRGDEHIDARLDQQRNPFLRALAGADVELVRLGQRPVVVDARNRLHAPPVAVRQAHAVDALGAADVRVAIAAYRNRLVGGQAAGHAAHPQHLVADVAVDELVDLGQLALAGQRVRVHAGDQLELRLAVVGGDVRVRERRAQRRRVRRKGQIARGQHAQAFFAAARMASCVRRSATPPPGSCRIPPTVSPSNSP